MQQVGSKIAVRALGWTVAALLLLGVGAGAAVARSSSSAAPAAARPAAVARASSSSTSSSDKDITRGQVLGWFAWALVVGAAYGAFSWAQAEGKLKLPTPRRR